MLFGHSPSGGTGQPVTAYLLGLSNGRGGGGLTATGKATTGKLGTKRSAVVWARAPATKINERLEEDNMSNKAKRRQNECDRTEGEVWEQQRRDRAEQSRVEGTRRGKREETGDLRLQC